MSTPEPRTPMKDQHTSALDMGGHILAIQHAVEALIKTLPRGDERAKFLRNLPKWPDDSTAAYKEAMRRFNKAVET